MQVDYHYLKNENVADFLIVTATEVETANIVHLIEPISEHGLLEVEFEGKDYTIGRLGLFNVVHCQCKEMGTQAVGSSTLTVANALRHWSCIKAVVMVGIAFGMYNSEGEEDQQHIGDILVATDVIPYENQRRGASKTEYRGKSLAAGQNFLDAFKIIKADWEEKNLYEELTKVEICPLLSGEKLVDNLEYRNRLKAEFKQARGGEMEGIGVAAAAEDVGKPWILLKAICDFGDGDKKKDKRNRQACAAYLAAKACKLAFNKVDVLVPFCNGQKTEYVYRLDKKYVNRVLFFRYDNDCEAYYLDRDVDHEIEDALKVKGCWISGETGIGKSVALTRVLMKNGKNMLLVDLSCCGDNPLADLFRTIYEMLCEKVSEKPEIMYTFNDYVQAISKLICKYFKDEEFYFFIEEIPISQNDVSKFQTFVKMFCAFVIQNTFQANNADVRFILSSLRSPQDCIADYQDKVKSYIKFIEMGSWKPEECISLTNNLVKILGFKWGDVSISEFTERYPTPRKIKDTLKTLFQLGKFTINKIDLNNL